MAATEADWRLLVEKALKGAPLSSLESTTDDGIGVKPLYAADDGAPVAGRSDSGSWGIAQRMDNPDPAAANTQALEDLEGGATALSIVFQDAPCGHGFGLPRDADAITRILDGVLPQMIQVRSEPHPKARHTTPLLAAGLVATGQTPDALNVSFGLDPIGNFARYGSLASLDHVESHMTRIVGELKAHGFAGPFTEADGRVYHDAGATAAQELAAVLATAVAYWRMTGDGAADDIGFTLALDHDQFEGIAKVRALRLLWARVQEIAGHTPGPARIHGETSWRMMAKADPHTNMLRTTIAAFSGAVGGVDTLAVLPFTTAHGLADSFARRVARNTQLVLAMESHLGHVADPAAGSGALCTLTDALAAEAWGLFQAIEVEGGIGAALQSGRVQSDIANARAGRDDAITAGTHTIVGTTKYPPPDMEAPETLDGAKWPAPVFKDHPLMATPLVPHALHESGETP